MGNAKNLMDDILAMLYTFREDADKLEKLCRYIREDIYEVPEDDIVIPEQYRQFVHDTADLLSAGMTCYINPDTLERIEIPQTVLSEMFFSEEEEEEEGQEHAADDEWSFYRADLKKAREWIKEVVVNPPESHESYQIMEDFVDSLPSGRMHNILSEAISRTKPFRHFNAIIHQSPAREEWFAFRQKKLEAYLWEHISDKLPAV